MKILNHWEILEGIVEGKNTSPISCEIDPSNLCNHNCVWCMYKDFRERERSMMPKDIMFNLIYDLAKGGVKSVTFTGGGEPLTNKSTVEGLYEVTNNNLEVGLVTNGGLINDRISDAIIDNCSFLRISLDAASLSTHTQLHRPKNPRKDNFNHIVKNLRHIVSLRDGTEKSMTIGVAFLVHQVNYPEIYEAAKLVKSIGVDYFQIRPVFLPDKQLSTKARYKTQQLIDQTLRLVDTNFHVFPILHRFDEVISLDRAYNKCLGHSLVGVVGADCHVYICCQLRGDPDFSFGNLTDKSFWDIWNSEQRKDAIKYIDLGKCPPCRYNRYNEILDYLADRDRLHKNFL